MVKVTVFSLISALALVKLIWGERRIFLKCIVTIMGNSHIYMLNTATFRGLPELENYRKKGWGAN